MPTPVSLNPIPLNTPGWNGNAGYGSGPPAWYEDSYGIVHLQGAVTNDFPFPSGPGPFGSGPHPIITPTPPLIGTLPPAARPDRNVYELVHTFNGTYADLAIGTDGTITFIGPRPPAVEDQSFVSLESISYPLQSTGSDLIQPITLNTTNWENADPVYGAAAPAGYNGAGAVDAIMLMGAAKLTVQQAPDATYMLGTLFPTYVPDRTVYTVVHTFAGTYSSFQITPGLNDQIWVLGGDPPAGPDYTFLSFEGVTYRLYSSSAGPIGSQPITINTANWKSDYVPGAQAAPGAYTDPQGIVYLQGLATQTSTQGNEASLLGTLPPTAWPNRTVYTIVQANGSSSDLPSASVPAYADVQINPQGQIWLIPSRPQPLPTFAFVSLDSITYLQ